MVVYARYKNCDTYHNEVFIINTCTAILKIQEPLSQTHNHKHQWYTGTPYMFLCLIHHSRLAVAIAYLDGL